MSFSTELLKKLLRTGRILKIDNETHSLEIIPMSEVTNARDVRLVFTIEELMDVFKNVILKETTVSILKDKMPLLKI